MTEDVKIPTKEELLGEVDDVGEEAPQLSAREQEAAGQGWMPEKDWIAAGKDPSGWRPAESWLDRGQFFSKINSLQSELQATRAQVAESFKAGQRMAEATYKQEIAELKAQKKQAITEGDFEKAADLDDKIDAKKEAMAQPATPAPSTVTPPPEYHLFIQRNGWYTSDSALRGAADGLGYEFRRLNPGATPADLFWYVESKMKEKFPEIAGGRRSLPPSPEGGSTNRGNASAGGSASLSSAKSQMDEVERGIMKTMIKTGVFKNEEEYLKQYVAAPSRRR